jgi:hypothetical protein
VKPGCDMNFQWSAPNRERRNPPIPDHEDAAGRRLRNENLQERVRIKRRDVRSDDASHRLVVWLRLLLSWVTGSGERRGNPYREIDGCVFDGSNRSTVLGVARRVAELSRLSHQGPYPARSPRDSPKARGKHLQGWQKGSLRDVQGFFYGECGLWATGCWSGRTMARTGDQIKRFRLSLSGRARR